jgi:hypothetical protein
MAKQRPIDPMEMAKQGNMATVTELESSVQTASEPVVTIDESDLQPPVPPPPPPKMQHYKVAEDKLVLLNKGRHSTWLKKGGDVSAETHDLDELAEQGVKLIEVDSA